jgi:hypothetical protein
LSGKVFEETASSNFRQQAVAKNWVTFYQTTWHHTAQDSSNLQFRAARTLDLAFCSLALERPVAVAPLILNANIILAN